MPVHVKVSCRRVGAQIVNNCWLPYIDQRYAGRRIPIEKCVCEKVEQFNEDGILVVPGYVSYLRIEKVQAHSHTFFQLTFRSCCLRGTFSSLLRVRSTLLILYWITWSSAKTTINSEKVSKWQGKVTSSVIRNCFLQAVNTIYKSVCWRASAIDVWASTLWLKRSSLKSWKGEEIL